MVGSSQQQIACNMGEAGIAIPPMTAPCKQAWKSFWMYPILCHSYMTDEQEADICILNACGEKVMSDTLHLSPYSETSLY